MMTPTLLAQRIQELTQRRDQARGALQVLVPKRDETRAQLEQTKANAELWRHTTVLLTHLAEYARDTMRSRIEDTVTAALQAVFPELLTFRVVMRKVGEQPVADWEVVSMYGDVEVSNSPEDSRGGGVTDVVSLALRLALLELLHPKVDGPLILDEPGKMISREHLPAVAEFLRTYAQRTGRQIIYVTHHEALADVADKAYRVAKCDGISEVTAA